MKSTGGMHGPRVGNNLLALGKNKRKDGGMSASRTGVLLGVLAAGVATGG
jgi:hypothetical protein